jgi:hypothetical protein
MSRTSTSRRRPSASRPELVSKKPARQQPVSKERVTNKTVSKKSALKKSALRKSARKNSALKSTPQTPRQRELTTKRRGELAELAFVLKAASLGFGVSRPFGDSERYDAILDARNPGRSSPPPTKSACHSDRSRSECDGAVEEPAVSAPVRDDKAREEGSK